MIRMVDIEYIRKKHFVEGWSIRKISKSLEIDVRIKNGEHKHSMSLNLI